MKRGFAIVALDNPKSAVNVGGAMRAVGIFGAASLIVGGNRRKDLARHPADTMKAWRHVPLTFSEDVLAALPFDCVPVAVDKVEGALPLWDYHHPERAFYIFGAEDATLGNRILSRCREAIYVPMEFCMNLAASVNVVLYDRLAKEGPR